MKSFWATFIDIWQFSSGHTECMAQNRRIGRGCGDNEVPMMAPA